MSSFWNTIAELWNYILHFVAQAVVHITPIAWPLVVLIVVLLFRKQLALLLSKLKEAKGFGVEIVTGDVTGAKLEHELAKSIDPYMPGADCVAGQPGASIQVGSAYAENHYFFSHDLMLCYCALITGADAEIITHTLQSAIAHLEKFGKDTPYHVTLQKLLEDAKKRSESDWTQERRRVESRKIWRISRQVGDIIQKESHALAARA